LAEVISEWRLSHAPEKYQVDRQKAT